MLPPDSRMNLLWAVAIGGRDVGTLWHAETIETQRAGERGR